MYYRGALERRGLGIDLGSRMAKVLLARQVANRVNVDSAAMFTFNASWTQDGIVKEPKLLGRLVAEQLKANGIANPFAVFSVPSQLATLRWVTLPKLSGDELREAARYKVKRHLPYPVDLAYVEATPPAVDEGQSQGQSLVIVVKKSVVDSRAEVLEHAGIVPISAELEAQAILRIVERKLNEKGALWRDASVTIIDMGSTNTHMYVVQNRQLQFMRGIRFGSERIARSVATETGLPYEEVEQAIGREGAELSPDGMLSIALDGDIVLANVKQDLDKLTVEFLRLLRYFRSLHPERSYAGILDHMIVCGGLAGLRGFAEYLHEALGLRVERAKPFSGMVGRFKRETFESIVNRQEAFTVVLGLALSNLESEASDRSSERVARDFVWSR